ncbi:MAG: hypothetical protein P4L26_13110 [Terracidiphilus sp.]|nr:hypothetical protein [Terracidiphilus sp.]
MRSKSFKRLLALATASLYVLSLGQVALAETEDPDSAPQALVGSWTVQVTQVNCQNGAALGSPFLSLLTFERGGTIVETTSNPMFFPALRGPGHGVWTHDRQGFKAVSVAFITLNGVLTKTQTITQWIEIGRDGDSFTTTSASIVLVPEGGSPTITGCATAAGKRIEIRGRE